MAEPTSNDTFMGMPRGWFGPSPLSDLATVLLTGASLGGTGFNIAQSLGGGGGGGGRPSFGLVPGTAHLNALSKYSSRILAQNSGAVPPTFSEFLRSGGTARFPLTGVGQFTPLEAVQLGIVPGSKKFDEIPYVGSGATGLTPDQFLFLKHQRRNKNRANKLLQNRSGGGKKKDEDPVKITVGTNSGDWGDDR